MAGINRLAGTPWHVERYARQEGDERRHRSRCKYYKGHETSYCTHYKGRCRGASHCSSYVEEKIRSKTEDKQKPAKTNKPEVFIGLKEIMLDKIIVDNGANHHPDKQMIKRIQEHYKKYGEMEKPIIVRMEGDSYHLAGNHIVYYAAKEMNLLKIPAECGSDEQVKTWAALREKGTLVWNNRASEVGEVIGCSLHTVAIKLDNGIIQKYDIHKCVENGILRPL